MAEQGSPQRYLFRPSPQLLQRPQKCPLCEKSQSCESQLDENRADIGNGIVNQPIDYSYADSPLPPLSVSKSVIRHF